MHYSSFPVVTNNGSMAKNLNSRGYYVESPKVSNADTEKPLPHSLNETDDNYSNPRESISSTLLSSRPSSATFSSEVYSVWRNGSLRRALKLSRNGSFRRALKLPRNRAVETGLTKIIDGSEEEQQGFLHLPRPCTWSLVMLCVLAAVFGIVWFICRPHPPELIIQDFKFMRVNLFAGTDRTNVPTYLISMDSKFNLTVRNRSKYYKMHLRHSVFTLYNNLVPIAKGQISDGLEQASNSIVVRSVSVSCSEAPLYGSGFLLEASIAKGFAEFLLTATIHTEFTIIRGLWNKHFNLVIRCGVLVNVSKLRVIHMDCKSTR